MELKAKPLWVNQLVIRLHGAKDESFILCSHQNVNGTKDATIIWNIKNDPTENYWAHVIFTFQQAVHYPNYHYMIQLLGSGNLFSVGLCKQKSEILPWLFHSSIFYHYMTLNHAEAYLIVQSQISLKFQKHLSFFDFS
uniref:Uncharacterized protein n=1 Tax=Arundo donax TaxID=35708 RepID=A0A0A9E3A4_ARUDO